MVLVKELEETFFGKIIKYNLFVSLFELFSFSLSIGAIVENKTKYELKSEHMLTLSMACLDTSSAGKRNNKKRLSLIIEPNK